MKKGFTLIELLVVVLIIGILAAVALPQYEISVEKSRAAKTLPVIQTIIQAYQMYYLNTGVWPFSHSGTVWFRDVIEASGVDLSGVTWATRSTFVTKEFVYSVGAGSYPIDPTSTAPSNAQLSVSRDDGGKYSASAPDLYRKYYYFSIIIYSDGTVARTCHYYNNIGKGVCASLPGEWTIEKRWDAK